ncbi:hypothetical protein CROQUDRAFT_521029 [Cronartium quercuum f. sp. fusiforme G11]|uniref:Uncharacterized protein n=1 Tax=Cronartium quercuum f. sp. fusiforme G11 TaxID=708437 RepID=A0A9P6NGD0_9BASI|nr:hypothetical protein CROQUDRAFT_521029 [Cronartium quercuum f. sp. fusiforme G11]
MQDIPQLVYSENAESSCFYERILRGRDARHDRKRLRNECKTSSMCPEIQVTNAFQLTVVSKNIVISSSRVVGRWSVRRAIPDLPQGILAPGNLFTHPLLRNPSTSLLTHRPRLSLTTSFPSIHLNLSSIVRYSPDIKNLAAQMFINGNTQQEINQTLRCNISFCTLMQYKALYRSTQSAVRDPATYQRQG